MTVVNGTGPVSPCAICVMDFCRSNRMTLAMEHPIQIVPIAQLWPVRFSIAPFILLRLRWLQLRRAFPPYGLVILALAVVAAILVMQRVMLQHHRAAPSFAGCALLIVWGLHQRRGDLHFLLRHVPQARQAMAMEYGVLMLPVLVGLLSVRAWAVAEILPLGCLTAWMPVLRSGSVRGAWLRRWVPVRLFEWRAFLQNTHPISLLLWVLAFAFCWLPVLPLFLLGIVALTATSSQEQCEPRVMLLTTATDGRSLLLTKVRGAVMLIGGLMLPVLVAATLFRPDWWWVHLGFGFGMVVMTAYAVVLKYANYHPGARLDANGANLTIAALFAILPGLSLVPLVMLLTEWPKARANLNAWFHAHHH